MFGMPKAQICSPATWSYATPRFYDKPINILGIDFVGPFPKSTNGNRYRRLSILSLPDSNTDTRPKTTTAARAPFDNVFLNNLVLSTELTM